MSRVVENNPGPPSMSVEPKKKQFTAPYSQGNEMVFGQCERQQCVAMSVCFLVYNHAQGINSAN